jgi:hypothetical protein
MTEPEQCAWMHGHWRWGRVCEAPSIAAVTDGRVTARVCRQHQLAAYRHGWREAEP